MPSLLPTLRPRNFKPAKPRNLVAEICAEVDFKIVIKILSSGQYRLGRTFVLLMAEGDNRLVGSCPRPFLRPLGTGQAPIEDDDWG